MGLQNKIRRNIFFFFSCIAFVAAFFLISTSRPSLALAASFPDVPENSEHYAAVEYLKVKGIISGYPDGTFQPDRNINRAETVKILLTATGTKLDSTQVINFPDVHESDWFFPYIRKAYELKIIEGYADGKFKPENNINLAESLKVILLSFQLQIPGSLTADPYLDVDKGTWYAPYAQYSKDKNTIMAQDDGELHAERLMSRAEFAEIIYRLMYIKEKNLDTFPLSTNWPTFTHPTNHYLVAYPFDWLKISAGEQIVFWKQDIENNQVSFARIYPNSATVIIAVDKNSDKLTLDQYLGKLQYDTSAIQQKSTLNSYPYASVALPSNGLEDFYFELPNHTILIAYTQIGIGALKPQLVEEVRYIIGSIRYSEQSSAISDQQAFLSEINKNLLVQGKGKSILGQIPDAQIIETDTIGIGTGPIDYYYSVIYDVTIKYERNSDTLIALKNGKTTAF